MEKYTYLCAQVKPLKPKKMAKLVGLIGTGRGRVGNVVLSKGLNGQTISRAYQPQVYNPNTPGQIKSRAIMTLAGLLSKITPSSLLVGMEGASKVERRSRFVSNICRRASLNQEGNALMAPVDLIFSEGKSLSLPAPTTTLDGGTNLVVQFDSITEWPTDLAGILVIGVCATSRTGNYIEVVSGIAKQSDATALLPIGGAPLVNIYAVPIMKKDGATAVDYALAVSNIQATNSYEAAVNALTAGIVEYYASAYKTTYVTA